jgi:hypothetical protein
MWVYCPVEVYPLRGDEWDEYLSLISMGDWGYNMILDVSNNFSHRALQSSNLQFSILPHLPRMPSPTTKPKNQIGHRIAHVPLWGVGMGGDCGRWCYSTLIP